LPCERGGQTGWPFDASTACTSPASSPAKRIDLPGKTGDVRANGTTGDREWATPVSAYGTHPEGQEPPVAPPRVSACTVRSFDITRMPSRPTTGGTTAVAPVAYAHLTAPVSELKGLALTVRPADQAVPTFTKTL
jgi:hypothetical protein